jgi:hypothetical protein
MEIIRSLINRWSTAGTCCEGGNMKKLITILFVALAATAQAGEVKIVETEAGITVEYTGTETPTTPAASVPSQHESPAPVAVNNESIDVKQAPGVEQKTAARPEPQSDNQPVRYSSFREGRMMQIQELKKQRMSAQSSFQ